MSAEYVEFETFKVLIRRKPHLRRSRLKISPTGQIEVLAPLKAQAGWIEDFLNSSKPWIKKTMERFKEVRIKFPEKKYVQGEAIFVFGHPLPIDFRMSYEARANVSVAPDSIRVRVPNRLWNQSVLMAPQTWARPLIKDHLKSVFSEFASGRIDYWAKQMALSPTRVGYRFQRTLWGSCNRQGHISLNCKLIGAPKEAIDYVIIHELAHLKHLNHSAKFWELVESFAPEHLQSRRWLRAHALTLEL